MPAIKWYVNLDDSYGTNTKSRAGQRIALVATRKLGHGLSRVGGREVDWALVDAGPHDGDLDYFQPLARASLQAPRSTEQRNGEFHNTLDVPALGGRTYTVTARKRTGANNVTFNKQYEAWRRIYYSLHYMNAHCRRLFESVEQEIKDIFAGVYIELKRRHIRACLVNEAVTDRTPDYMLPHTYDDERPALDRAPHHLRAVLVRNLNHSSGFDVHWTMDSTTTTDPTKLIGISSQGTNHREVRYTNKVSVIDAVTPSSRLAVHVHSATVTIPNACITRTSDHRLTVDLTAHLSTAPLGTAIYGGAKANLKATVTGRRCPAGFEAGNDHPIQATISAATTEQAPVTVGSAKIWTANDGAVAIIQDPHIILADPGPADQLRITLPDTTSVDIQATAITRADDNTLRIDLSGAQAVVGALGDDESVGLSVRRHGILGRGPVEAEADFEFDYREFRRYNGAARRKFTVAVAGDGRSLTIEATWLWLANADALTMTLETLGAAIDIPATVVSVPDPQTLQVDLGGHVSLQAAAQAMANGGKLTFDGRLRGLHAVGGYSPGFDRDFIALTARKLGDDEPDTTTARRIKLVFCHELGHALGLNYHQVRNEARGANEINELRYRDEYGGQGPHCSFNAHLQPSGADHGRESTSSGEIYVHAGGGALCIMYHALDLTHMGNDFCPTCKAHLRRAQVQL